MIIGLCRPPRVPASKAGGNLNVPWQQFLCLSLSHLLSSLSLRRETPEVPSSVGTVQSPFFAQAQEVLTTQLALSSTSGRCCHGNSRKAGSSEGSEEERMERPCMDIATPSWHTETLTVAPADLLASSALQPVPISVPWPQKARLPSTLPSLLLQLPPGSATARTS